MLRKDVKQQLTLSDAKVVKVEAKMKRLETQNEETKLKVGKLDDMQLQMKGLSTRIDEWEKKGKGTAATIQRATAEADDHARTMVIGGLKGEPLAEKTVWLKTILTEAGVNEPTDVYVKDGDETVINNILFAKFVNEDDRNKVIKTLKKAAADGVWFKPDMPIEIRALNSFLFGFKYFLVEAWDYTKFEVHVDMVL